MKFTTKLLLLVTSIIALSVIANTMLLGHRVRSHLQDNQLEWTQSLVRSLSESVARGTIDGNKIYVRELLLQVAKKDQAVEYAYVTDMDARLFAHSFDKGFPRFLAKNIGKAEHADGLTQAYDTRQGRIMEFSAPLVQGMAARLYLGISESEINSLTGRALREMVWVIALVGIAGLGVALIIGRRLSRPLSEFNTQLTRYMDNKDATFPSLRGSDPDIRQMVQAFETIIAARDRAEDSLREREENLSLTLDSIGDAVIATNHEGRVTRMNPVAEKLTGWRLKEAREQLLENVFPIVDADDGRPIETPVKKVLRTGEIVTLSNNTTLLAKQGQEYQIADSAAPIRDSQKNIIGIILVFHDVTEQYRLRKAAEEQGRQLKQSEAQVRLLLESMAEAIYGIDTEGLCTFANPSCARLLGYESSSQLVGRNMHELVHHSHHDGKPYPLDKCRIHETLREIREIHVDDEVLWRKDGSHFDAEYWAHPILDNDVCVGAVVNFIDISQRRRDEEALRASRQRLLLHREQTPLGVIEWNTNLEVTDWNPAAEKIFGYQKDEIMGKPVALLMDTANAPKQISEAWEPLISGNDALHHVGEYKTRQGETRLCEWYNTRLVDGEGRMIGAASLVDDVTERRHTEEALRRSQKMEAVGQLSGGIAHDFNNQLGIIIGYLDFLKGFYADQEQPRKWVESAHKATLRCIDLTRQLLGFSRRQTQEINVLDLNGSISELKNMVARSVTPQVEVRYQLPNDLWRTKTNNGEFQDALLNTVLNARDAMPAGGTLTIETSNKRIDEAFAAMNPGLHAGDYVHLSVSDTGTGMSKEVLEHVFEPFFTTKPEGKGTGLGMAMIYGFVQRFSGAVSIDSKPGVGTTLHMFLPRSNSGEPASGVDQDEGGLAPRGSERILVVDDEPALLELANLYLSDLGYEIYLAENAGEALSFLRQDNTDIDLLFSDVVMPGGINGYELAHQATRIRPELKVLLTSGFTAKSMVNDDHMHFSENLLNKPYCREDMALRIREILDR